MLLKNLLSVSFKNYKAVVFIGICKKRIINDLHFFFFHKYSYILVVKLNILHLGIGFTVRIHNTIAAEAVVAGSLSVIAAIGKIVLAKAVLFTNGLIHEVPDKAALVTWLSVSKISVLEHSAAGIGHGMGVLAADKGLVLVLRKELLDIRRLRIHLTLHVAGVVVSPVVADSLIVNQSVGIKLSKELRHLIGHLTAVGLISYGPDQN